MSVETVATYLRQLLEKWNVSVWGKHGCDSNLYSQFPFLIFLLLKCFSLLRRILKIEKRLNNFSLLDTWTLIRDFFLCFFQILISRIFHKETDRTKNISMKYAINYLMQVEGDRNFTEITATTLLHSSTSTLWFYFENRQSNALML